MRSTASKSSLSSVDSKFSSTSQQVTVSYNSVTIFLFEAKDLPAMDRNGLSDPFCKFRLGGEKFRSRVIKKTLNPQWLEEFHLFLHDHDSKKLEVSVWDWDRTLKNEVIGRAEIDLAPLDHGKTYDFWLDIKEKNNKRGSVHLSVLINDKKDINELMPSLRTEMERQRSITELQRQKSSEDALENELPLETNPPIGTLTVNLLNLENLPMSSDNDGKHVYCILQLGLVRFQTHTVSKSTSPEWNSQYSFPIHDVHSILEMVVMDRDAKGKISTVGCLALPLLNVQSGSPRAYLLKDKKLRKFTGISIQVEMSLKYDLLGAALKTIRPKEDAPTAIDRRVSPQVLVHKVNQIRKVVTLCADALQHLLQILSWESPQRTVIAYVCCVIAIYFFQLYWLPLSLLVVLLRGYFQYTQPATTDEDSEEDDADSGINLTSESAAKFNVVEDLVNLIPGSTPARNLFTRYFNRENGASIVNNVKTAHGQARFVQHVLEFMADIYERLMNVANFTVPWLSFFAIGALLGATVGLYFLSLRAVMFLWITYEFAKGYFGYHNFELLDFLSRVHTKEERKMYETRSPQSAG